MDKRLPPRDGQWIDRSQVVEFRFEGRTYQGYRGDVLSSALWANGVRLLGRSFKYHRPRGIYSLAGHDANVIVENGRHTNLRGDTLAIEPGLDVRAVNTVGGLRRDRLRAAEWFSSFLPVGFYYKAFHTPRRLFPFYENQMRKVAGLGKINPDNLCLPSPKDYAFCDLLVVGAGPAGLAGGLAAARQGLDVLLVDEQPRPGGSLAWQGARDAAGQAQLRQLLEEARGLNNLEIRCATQAAGCYADHWIALVDGRRLTKLRAAAMLVAAGCFEQPAVFGNNDLPGVMLASAAQRLMHLYAVRPCERAVVLAGNRDGYRAALDLLQAGVDVAAVVDPRPGGEASQLAQQVADAQIDVLAGHTVFQAVARAGKTRIAAAHICPLDDAGRLRTESALRVACDGLVVSVGWAPNAGLVYQAGGRLGYDTQLEQFLPHQLPAGLLVAGRANGVFDLPAQIADGRRAGLAAAAHLGRYDADLPAVPRQLPPPPSHPYPIYAHPGKKNFVDLDEDVHLADVAHAHQEGYDNIELMKRYTTVGMGPSQGKLSNMNAVRILARLNGASIDETGTTTSRPFYQPVPLGLLAGRRFHPLRHTPIHDWHLQAGAEMVHVGAWLRPEYYRSAGKSRDDCILDEALAVRQRVGLIDLGTLGKIQLAGPDAAHFLERIYTGRYASQQVGRLRYALACDETGVIIEDGVVARLGDEQFYVTATTGGAAGFYREMQRWALIFGMQVSLANASGQLAAMNLAGPHARQVLSAVTDVDLAPEAFPYLAVREGPVAGAPAILMRVGFVGELGYEIHVPASCGAHVWNSLLQAGAAFGIRPFGVEAQRLLRLEKGHLIVGQDTDALTHPYEADVAWAIGKRKSFFVGSRSLEILQKKPLARQLVGLVFPPQSHQRLPEECHLIIERGEIAGRITSMARRSTCGQPLAMAFVRPDLAEVGRKVRIRVDGGKWSAAEVAALPFYDPDNFRQQEQPQEAAVAGGGRDAPPRPTAAEPASAVPVRCSPIHGLLPADQAEWKPVGGMPLAVRLKDAQAEAAAARSLALCDISGPAKLGVKGTGAESWLTEAGVELPAAIYESCRLSDGGLIVRLAADEFFMESGLANETVPALARQLDPPPPQAHSLPREDATFLLVGTRGPELLAQTCGINFARSEPGQLVLTRVAGVSCGVLPQSLGDVPAWRLWVDYTFARYLWEQLREICRELDGSIIGAACLHLV